MTRLSLLTTILSSVLFCVSCTSVKTIVLDVQKPAEITISKTIASIGIVNNAVPQPATYGHRHLKYTEKGERTYDEVSLPADSNCILLTELLFEELSGMNYFNNVSLYEYPLREDLAFEDVRRIDSLDVIELAEIMNVDAIISLDRFVVGSLSYEQPLSFEAEDRYLDMKMNTVFHIYSKNGNLISPPLSLSDSVYWQGMYDGDFQISYEGVPELSDAVKGAIAYIASASAASFVPQWIEEYRTYYGDIKEANKKVEADDWKGALEIWKASYEAEQKNMKKKARLAGNIALAYEITDNIKEALVWSDTAVKLFTESAETSVDMQNKENAESYHTHLIERFREFKVLDLQDRD